MPSLRSHIVRLILRYLIAPKFRRASGSVEKIRMTMNRLAKYQRVPYGITVQPTTVGGIEGEWIGAPDIGQNRLVLFLHGGGFIAGSPATHRELAARIASDCVARVLIIDYRLAPEHPFPAAVEDSIRAFRALVDEGFSNEQIVIGGDSSGGGLALQTLISLRDSASPLPQAAFFLSPMIDWVHFDGLSYETRTGKDPMLTPSMCRYSASCYVADNDPSTPLLSPVRMNLSGLPPMLIHVGDREILFSDATILAEKARKADVDVTFRIWQGLWHGFHASANVVPEARQAINELGLFVRDHVERT
jgi:monoterpene epsilon-lactone hydrolase